MSLPHAAAVLRQQLARGQPQQAVEAVQQLRQQLGRGRPQEADVRTPDALPPPPLRQLLPLRR